MSDPSLLQTFVCPKCGQQIAAIAEKVWCSGSISPSDSKYHKPRVMKPQKGDPIDRSDR